MSESLEPLNPGSRGVAFELYKILHKDMLVLFLMNEDVTPARRVPFSEMEPGLVAMGLGGSRHWLARDVVAALEYMMSFYDVAPDPNAPT